MTRAETMKELEHEIQYNSVQTKRQYRCHVTDFLDFVGNRDWREREVVYAYIDHLRKKKTSQTYINYIIRGPVGCLFRMHGLRLPVKLPKMGRERIRNAGERKSYTFEEVVQLIKTARASQKMQWQNMMALSSIYGLRSGEIRQLVKEDVHPLKKTILIHTEKGGDLREHQVPPEIAALVFKYDYPPMLGNHVFDVFASLAEAAGVEHHNKGLHAVRHRVITELEDLRDEEDKKVFENTDIYRFMRWAGGTIMNTYASPSEPVIDKRILARHPFLQYWK